MTRTRISAVFVFVVVLSTPIFGSLITGKNKSSTLPSTSRDGPERIPLLLPSEGPTMNNNTAMNASMTAGTGENETMKAEPTKTVRLNENRTMVAGSRLRMHSTVNDGLGNTNLEGNNARTARHLQSRRGQRYARVMNNFDDISYDDMNLYPDDSPVQVTYKYAPGGGVGTGGAEAVITEAGDRDTYYYNDFSMNSGGFDEKPTRAPPSVDKHSCRQYLEFLRYAFEQIDQPQRKYADPVFGQPANRVYGENQAEISPPVIVADPNVINQLAYPGSTEMVSTESSTVTTLVASDEIVRKILPSSTTGTSDLTSLSFTEPLHTAAATSVESTTAMTLLDDGCADKLYPCPDNMNVTYPVNGYCNRFVVCESGRPTAEFCQEGLHFNPVTRQCDLPHNSICTYSCPQANGYFALPGDCNGFFRCSDWYPEYRMCPPRMHWDIRAKICTFSELSSCPLKCDALYEVKPYTGVCNSYIICTRGVARYHKCPDGYHFDRAFLRCVPKRLSGCTDDSDFIVRNRGMENGRKTLCADVELIDGKSRWCQIPEPMS